MEAPIPFRRRRLQWAATGDEAAAATSAPKPKRKRRAKQVGDNVADPTQSVEEDAVEAEESSQTDEDGETGEDETGEEDGSDEAVED